MMDMHCHIDLYPNPKEIIDECISKKMYVLSVTTTPKAWRGTYELTKGIPRFNTALGLHPQLAHLREHELDLFDSYISETKYIGEIGLDYSKEYRPYIDIQLRVFRHILKKCQSGERKIMTIHTRGAVSMVLDELEGHPDTGTPILHWFLGTKREMNRAIDLGCVFSIGPAMTISQKGRKIIEWLPKDKVLLETDGPFASLRNKKLHPVDSFMMIEYLSEKWKFSQKSVIETLRNNLKTLVL